MSPFHALRAEEGLTVIKSLPQVQQPLGPVGTRGKFFCCGINLFLQRTLLRAKTYDLEPGAIFGTTGGFAPWYPVARVSLGNVFGLLERDGEWRRGFGVAFYSPRPGKISAELPSGLAIQDAKVLCLI